MLNKLMSIFNSGTINQSNNHFYNATVETQIKQINRTFEEGRISLAFSDLDGAKEENKLSPHAVYNFLILKAKFYLILKNFKEIEELISYLENEFKNFLDVSFYEIQATIFSYDNNTEDFKRVIEKIRIEFSIEQLNDKYTELIFLLNTNDLENAKVKYDEYKLNRNSFKDKRIDYIGGMIYSQLFFKSNKKDFADISKEIFSLYIKENEVNFFDKLDIYKTFSLFHASLIFSSSIIDKDYKEEIKITLDLLNQIINDINYFGENTKNDIQNSFLHCLWLNEEKDEFLRKYKTFDESKLDLLNYFTFNVLSKNIDEINHIKIESYISSKKEALIPYLNYLFNKSAYSKIITFLEQNKGYLEDDVALSIFVESHILLKIEIPTEIDDLINRNKNNSLLRYVTYLEILQYKKEQEINTVMAEELENYFDEPIEHNILILKALKIFINNNYFKKFFSLALKYKDHKDFVNESLKLVYENKNVYLIDIENFIENINENEYLNIIGNIYEKYGVLSKAYLYYKKMWKPEKDFINFTCAILNNCSIPYFHKNNSARIDKKQDDIYIKFLESNIDSLNIEQLLILTSFKIIVQKSYSDGFYYINKRLLNIDITELEHHIKEHLSKLYFYTITYEKDEKLSIHSNLIIEENGIFYLSTDKYTEMNSIFNIQLIDNIEYRLLLQNENIQRLSCFHIICNYFLHNMGSNNFVSKKFLSKDDFIEQIEEMIHNQRKNSQEKIEDYSKGNLISFNNLSNKSYENYFELIPMLYENNSINFDSGQCNQSLESVNKILTLSSIVFIDHLKKLDYVLSRKDIFIQATTVDFLFNFIERLNNEDEIMTLHSDGNRMFSNIKYIKYIKDIQKDKDYLVYLATKITQHQRIVDDREAGLQIAGSEEILVPQIGYQEYKAIAYSSKYTYQIITEDRILSFMFEKLNFNMNMVSNSSFLLVSDLRESKPEELGNYYIKLHSKKYKHILNKATSIELLKNWIFNTPELLLTKGYEGKLFKSVISICYSYGWMAEIDKYYSDNYKFKVGMNNTPKKDYIAKNIEYLRELSNFFNEKFFANNAIESFKTAREEALAKEQKIYVSEDDGFIYEKTSKNEKKFIKKSNKKIRVDTSKTIDLQ